MHGIICFSGRFCDNSLLVLKMRFQVSPFTTKKVQGFSGDRKILMSLLSVLFQKPCLSFLKFGFLAKIYGDTFIMSLQSTSFPKELLIEAFYLPSKTLRQFCRRKTAENNNAKIDVSPSLLCTFDLVPCTIRKIYFPHKF